MTGIIHKPSSFEMITFILPLGQGGAPWGLLNGESLEVNAPCAPKKTRVIDGLGVTSGVTFGGGYV